MLPFESCKLKLLDENDLEKVLKWRNSENVRTNMFTAHIISWEEHLSWYKKITTEQSNKCMLFEYEEIPIGLVQLTNIDEHNSRCYWGFYIGDKDAPKGSGLAMGYLALEYIFEELKVRKLCSEVLAFNKVSIEYQKKLGFSVEGYLKEHILRNKVFEDIVLLALFQKEWHDIKDALLTKCFGG